MLELETNRVNLYGTQAFWGVLKGAESKYDVCSAQKMSTKVSKLRNTRWLPKTG